MERFVRQEPLRRVQECVFGVLALESEPIVEVQAKQHDEAMAAELETFHRTSLEKSAAKAVSTTGPSVTVSMIDVHPFGNRDRVNPVTPRGRTRSARSVRLRKTNINSPKEYRGCSGWIFKTLRILGWP